LKLEREGMPDIDHLDEWLTIPPGDLPARSPIPVRILRTKSDVHRAFADTMFEELQAARNIGQNISLIVPVGPTGGYPPLAAQINEAGLRLDHVTFFGMDNWLDWQGRALSLDNPNNLEGEFHRVFLDRLEPALRPRPEDVVFPISTDLERSAREIERRGGVATTYGGFGFQGHLAFNEPPASRWTQVSLEEFRDSATRILAVSVDTIIAHAQRSAGGNVFAVPPMAITLGMRELLGAKRIRLYTETGSWKQTILRILLFSQPTVDYPVTLVHDHPDVEVVVDAESAQCPRPSH
jgi:6-phosphogluconolactonase/Glucosamine-6-phosphate isomerase/deaminase